MVGARRNPLNWRWLLWLTLPPVIGLTAFTLTEYVRAAGPVAAAPSMIDLGIQEESAVVTTEIIYKNDGRAPLELSRFSVSCPSCFSLALRTSEGAGLLETVRIEPRQSVVLVVRVSVSGSPSSPFRGFIDCQTNDPRVPLLRIWLHAEIRGRLFAVPSEVSFASLRRGASASRMISLRRPAQAGDIVVARVEVEGCDFISATYSPIDDGAADSAFLTGQSLGTVVVTVSANDLVGSFSANLHVYVAGEEQRRTTIQVSGEVMPEVVCRPAAIVLPRVVGEQQLYSATLVLSSPMCRPVSVTVKSIPRGVAAHSLPHESSPFERRFLIEWSAGVDDESPRSGLQMAFQVDTEGGTSEIEVPIRFLEARR